MRINTSTVEMTSKTNKTIKYGCTKQTLSQNLFSGEKMYSETTEEINFENSITHKSSCSHGNSDIDPNDCPQTLSLKENAKLPIRTPDLYLNYNNQGKIKTDNPSAIEALPHSTSFSQKNFLDQLRIFLITLRNKLFSTLRNGSALGLSNGILDVSSGGNMSVWKRTTYVSYQYEEKEEMQFKTTGTVLTEDGKQIDFNMNLNISRSYSESSDELYQGIDVIYSDPLVISLDSNPTSISDQHWTFDLNNDGNTDILPMLKSGSGFLAYDKNEDGTINNGSELFGTKLGDGFKELEAYDTDKNGWIDENDEIYNKLSIWIKNDSGEDKLITLKEANIGAISLQNALTQYDYTDEENNILATSRKTGIILTEDGNVQSINQIDFARKSLNY